jgi:hypothetical protein
MRASRHELVHPPEPWEASCPDAPLRRLGHNSISIHRWNGRMLEAAYTGDFRTLRLYIRPPMAGEGDVSTWTMERGMPVTRQDLSGLRVRSPVDPAIFLIDPEGYRRHVPDPATYNNLFRDWSGIIVDINIPDIALADPLSPGAVLARAADTPHVYLVSNGIKRHITSPAVMDKYHFSWGQIRVLPRVVMDAIPTGLPWG